MCSTSRDVTAKMNTLVKARPRPNQNCIVPLLLYCMSDCTHDWRRLELVDKLFRDTIKTHMVQFQNYWIEVLVERISFLELKVDELEDDKRQLENVAYCYARSPSFLGRTVKKRPTSIQTHACAAPPAM